MPPPVLQPSQSYSSDTESAPPLGSTEPRLWTPPLRELTPDTSYGYDVIRFAAEVLHYPLDPWEQWAAIHGCELLPDGRPRFRILLIEVARQNGKTTLLVVLALYWQFVIGVPLTLGTSTKLDYAKESWTRAVRLAEAAPELAPLRPQRWKREANGEQESWTLPSPISGEQARYKIAASNAEGGRSLTVGKLILDELRQHHSYAAWSASVPAGNAVPDFQAWAMTNAGEARSVVLNDLHDSCVKFLDTGEGDPRTGMFSWSCEDDADPLDVHALAQANPNLGRRIPHDSLLADARRAVALGGEALTSFKTECMCIRVRLLASAVDAASWAAGAELGNLNDVRDRVACCLDVAPDGKHATLTAAAVLADGRVRGEVVAAWDSTKKLRRDLRRVVARVKPRVFGWFPTGPAAAIAADLVESTAAGWPPAGVRVEAIKSEATAVCMGLADLVATVDVVHSDDPLLNAHVTGAERLARGDGWVFSRRGEGHCDGA
jgi:hypothetical protein